MCVCSPARPHAHRRLHPAAAEWRKKLRRPSEQAVRSPCAHGHSCVHRNPRRPAHSGETLWREINERIYFFHLSTNEGRKSCVWQKETAGWRQVLTSVVDPERHGPFCVWTGVSNPSA